MDPPKRTYTAEIRWSDGWWAISVLELEGVHSQVRRLGHAEATIREAIALLLDADPQTRLDYEIFYVLTIEGDSTSLHFDHHKDQDIVAIRAPKIPGITVRCVVPSDCPKRRDPITTSWWDGCWCYRNQIDEPWRESRV